MEEEEEGGGGGEGTPGGSPGAMAELKGCMVEKQFLQCRLFHEPN